MLEVRTGNVTFVDFPFREIVRVFSDTDASRLLIALNTTESTDLGIHKTPETHSERR